MCAINKCSLVRRLLVGNHFLLRDFGPYRVFLNMCFFNPCHGSDAKGFCALCDNLFMTMDYEL
jgi:hypothetical protein